MDAEVAEGNEKPENPFATMGYGLLCLALAYFLHSQFSQLETGAVRSIRMNALIILAYKTIGHWPTVGIFGIGGLFLIRKGWRKLNEPDTPTAVLVPSPKEQSQTPAARMPVVTADKDILVCQVQTLEGTKHFVTPLPADVVTRCGLAEHAIIGELKAPIRTGERITSGQMTANPKFEEFLHRFLEEQAPNDPRLKAQARRFSDGSVHVVDQRTPPPLGEAPPKDVIGSLRVSKGEIVRGSYKRNDHHMVLSDAGFFKLGPRLHALLVHSLTASLQNVHGSNSTAAG